MRILSTRIIVEPPSSLEHILSPGDYNRARVVLFLLLAVFTLTFTGLPDVPDAEVEFQTARSIAAGGGLALGGTPEADLIITTGHCVMQGTDERYYSWFGPGQAFVAVPLVLAGRLLERAFPGVEEAHGRTTHYGAERTEYFAHLLVGWRNPLLTALTAWLLVLTARRLGARGGQAVVTGLTYGLCTYAWPQARSWLSDVQATFFLFLAFHLLVLVRVDFLRRHQPKVRYLLGFGLALGMAFLTRVATAPAVGVLLLLLAGLLLWGHAYVARRADLPGVLRSILTASLPAVLLFAAFLWLNNERFGDPLESGYSAGVGRGFYGYPVPAGLAGLLVSPGRGLLWLAPAVILVPFGIRHCLGNGERLLPITLLLMFVAVFAVPATTQTWHGAWTFGPRYVLPALPFLWLGVGRALACFEKRRVGQVLATALLSLGFVANFSGVLVDHMTHQSLAMQAARLEWTELGEDHHSEAERFGRIQWSWRHAAPWAHWRILRHRVAGLGEEFPAEEIFFGPAGALLSPVHERDRGFRHLAWVDLQERLDGPGAIGVLLALGLCLGAALSTVGGLESARP